jgi:hypothetical protein
MAGGVIMSNRSLFKTGGLFAIIGSVLILVVNILHPSGWESVETVANYGLWVPVHIGLAFGVLFILWGLVALHRSFNGKKGAATAKFGMVTAIAGTAINLVHMGVDGIANKMLAMEWANAAGADQLLAEQLFRTVDTIGFGMFSMWITIFLGVTYLVFGITVSSGEVFPRWLGYIAILGGAASLVIGIVQGVTGKNLMFFRPFAILNVLWTVVIGILLIRKAEELAR